MAELGQLADEHLHHFLDEVIDVRVRQQVATQPVADERRIQVGEALPRLQIGPQPQTFQQTDRSIR